MRNWGGPRAEGGGGEVNLPPKDALSRLDGSANIPPRGIEADFFNFSSSRRVEFRGLRLVRLKIDNFTCSGP